MDSRLFGEGAVLGVSTAIPIKYGVSLDPIYYGILVIKTVNNTTASLPNSANYAFNLNSSVNFIIIILAILGVVLLIVTLLDAYQKIKEDMSVNLPLYVIGFLFGFFLILLV